MTVKIPVNSNLRKEKSTLTLGFSPCPNDTFIFDGLVNGKIETNGLSFQARLEDVETLNRFAINAELDITKISFAVYPQIREHYELLTAGSALGNGVGPLFISKRKFSDPLKEIKTIAIPGKNTTAFFLFKMFYPSLINTKEMIFSEIEDALLNETVDAGVIIHENRFTYQDKGLRKISDLGDLWENKTGHPIPLGGIAVRRSLDKTLKKEINGLIRSSVQFAFNYPDSSREYVRQHAQEMSEDVRKKHIQLYVNDFSVDLGVEGKKAIELFLDFEKCFPIDSTLNSLFI
jgi:1,4-dihydroxy-6-naphthoate synthase